MLKPVKRPNSPFYVARGTINGRQIERSTKTDNLRDARKACERIAAEIIADNASAVPQGKLTVSQAIALYRQQKPNARFLDKIERYFGKTLVKDVNNAEMRKAANALYPSASEPTIRRQLYTPLTSAINFCAEDDLCAPARFKAPSGGTKRMVFFTPDQAALVLANLTTCKNEYIPALVTSLFGQGFRVGEALAIDGSDVNLDLRYAILRDTKNGEERMVTLTSKVIAAWSRLPSVGFSGPLFRRLDGMPFEKRENRGGQIARVFREAVEASGLDAKIFTPHVCRHSWATWFYDQTKDILRLKQEGGWKSEEYQRYAKVTARGIGDAALRAGWDFSGENQGSENSDEGKTNAYA
jgi:integrase